MISNLIELYERNKNSNILVKIDTSDLRLVESVRDESRMLLSLHEGIQIIEAVRAAKKIPGDVAEVGTYAGGSAKLICETEKEKPIHLFDTFEGIPNTEEGHSGQYYASLKDVRSYLSQYKNATLYPGIFPETGDAVQDRTFSFVHLDVDIYESTKNSLEFFYPRMSRGGIIMSHDYMDLRWGAREAIDEFMADKPEAVFRSSRNQCLIVKI